MPNLNIFQSLNHVHKFELWIILGIVALVAYCFYELRIFVPGKK